MERPTLRSTLSQLDFVPKYAKYNPKINLEILTARKADIMLVLTYLMFFACLAGVITISLYVTSYNEIYRYPSLALNSSSFYSINFTITGPPNILFFQLQVSQTNFTSLVGWKHGSQAGICASVELSYASDIFACFDSIGCTEFASSGSASSATNSNVWQLALRNDLAKVDTDMCALQSSNDFTLTIVPALYHVQVRMFYYSYKCFVFH